MCSSMAASRASVRKTCQNPNADRPSSATTRNHDNQPEAAAIAPQCMRENVAHQRQRLIAHARRACPARQCTASESSVSCPPAAGGSGSGSAAGIRNTGGNHQGPVQIGCRRLFGHHGEFRPVVAQPDYRLQAQFSLGDLLAVDVRTVRAPDIANTAQPTVAHYLEVIKRDGRALLPLNDNVVVRGAPDLAAHPPSADTARPPAGPNAIPATFWRAAVLWSLLTTDNSPPIISLLDASRN